MIKDRDISWASTSVFLFTDSKNICKRHMLYCVSTPSKMFSP